MILYDLSSLIHRALHTSIKQMNPHKKDGKYVTQEFISGTIFRVIEELLENYRLYRGKYHTMVICIDDHSIPYWRKSLYPDYKAQRKVQRDESEINFKEVYKHINLLIRVLNDYTPFKAISVPGAEADDIIGVLTKKFSKAESILILSPDKDFKQLHKFGDVKQYSAITNEWVVNNDPESWEIIHCCLGDAADNVPRIVDFSEFTTEFKDYYKGTELDFYKLDENLKRGIIKNFSEIHPDVEVYKKQRFGEATLNKKIKEFGSLDAFLDSNEIYRLNYNRNCKLVMDGEIPMDIELEILKKYIESSTDFDMENMNKYFSFYNITICSQWFGQLWNEMSKPIEMTPWNVDFSKI